MKYHTCPVCNKKTEMSHAHHQAHGFLPGTHMDGSEYFRCQECKTIFTANHELAHKLPFVFDKPLNKNET